MPHQHQLKLKTLSSSVKGDTLTPVWNEHWKVRNVPTTATLIIEVHDKDMNTPNDDYIGKASVTVSPGAKEAVLESQLLKRDRGTLWLKVYCIFQSGTASFNSYR